MSDMTQQHTEKGKAAIRRAHMEAYRLADSAEACIEAWERIALPFIEPHLRAEAMEVFRTGVADPQFRTAFVLDMYRATLHLYAAGAFD